MQHPETLLILLFFLGIVAQFFSFVPKDLYHKINKFIIFVPLPAITLSKIPHLPITPSVMFPIASAWIIFIVSIAYAFLVSKIFKFERKTTACFILCCGLGNTSFVGYPLLKYLYGEQSIQYAIFVDQPGSFLILSTFGILTAAYFSSSEYNYKQMAERLFKFPPFLVFILALFIPAHFIEGKTLWTLDLIGKCMVPLAMLSLGLQFKRNIKDIEWKKFFTGIFYKLILAPLLIFILVFIFLHKRGEMYTITVMECAMPPMITSSILATEYELDENLAAYLPTFGLLLSIPTLFLWKWILMQF
ncbi:MAG: Membrane transport protein [Bacteroidota bacterium]|nr:Membrane transport protein [Bacteroidota bacterium]